MCQHRGGPEQEAPNIYLACVRSSKASPDECRSAGDHAEEQD
jgi:hypothetical protein